MCAILQLVSATLNPIPIAEHLRRSHPQCEHSYGQHIYMSKENDMEERMESHGIAVRHIDRKILFLSSYKSQTKLKQWYFFFGIGITNRDIL